MPTAAPRPCTAPGCGALVRDGTSRCEKHKAALSNFTREKSRHARGYGSAWTKLREVVLTRDAGLCLPCSAAGRVTAGTIVDHKQPKAEGGTDDLSNLQTICKRCHANKTALESARGRTGVSVRPDWLPVPRIPVLVVCGPAGSGKSTYVRDHLQAGELVLDVDELAAELTGKPLYHSTFDERMAAIRLRNRRLADLAASDCPYSRAWLIVTAGTPEDREFWRSKYGADLLLMTTPKTECVKRIQADERRPAEMQRLAIKSVYEWW